MLENFFFLVEDAKQCRKLLLIGGDDESVWDEASKLERFDIQVLSLTCICNSSGCDLIEPHF